jgi:N-acyl-D-amino-acid deacylase
MSAADIIVLGVHPTTSVTPAPGLFVPPQQTFGLADRGVLKQGFAADIVVFDENEIDEAASFAKPIQRAKGIDTVIVNGAVVWREGKPTGARPGRVLARTA